MYYPVFWYIPQKFSPNTPEKYIVNENNCNVHRNDKMFFLPVCRYHSLLIGDIGEFLQKVLAFCFTYQQVDCLYTLFQYHFDDKPSQDKNRRHLLSSFQKTKPTQTSESVFCGKDINKLKTLRFNWK